MIPQQVIGGIQCPAGYPCLWHYYGTVSFYARKKDQYYERNQRILKEIREKTGWPEYHPTGWKPEIKDYIWADTDHARGVRAKYESGEWQPV